MGASTPSAWPSFDALRGRLEAASQGLLYATEIDAPFRVVSWPGRPWPLSDDALQKMFSPRGAPLRVLTIDRFLRGMIEDVDPGDSTAMAHVGRFRQLKAIILTTLRDPVVVRVGEPRLTYYVVGAIDGGVAGLMTEGLET